MIDLFFVGRRVGDRLRPSRCGLRMCFNDRFSAGVIDFFFVDRSVADRLCPWRCRLWMCFDGGFGAGVINFIIVDGRSVADRLCPRRCRLWMCFDGGFSAGVISFIFVDGRSVADRLDPRMCGEFVGFRCWRMGGISMEVFQRVNPDFLMSDWFDSVSDNDFDMVSLKPFDAEPMAMLVVDEMVHFAMSKRMVPFVTMQLMAVEVMVEKMPATHKNKQIWRKSKIKIHRDTLAMKFPAAADKHRSGRNGSPAHVTFPMPPDHPRGRIFISRDPDPAAPEHPASIMEGDRTPGMFRFPLHSAIGIHPVTIVEIGAPPGREASGNPTPRVELR